MPTISVIVPVYKVEKYIHRCMDSILRQTYADFELILVDDGSPDNCSAICDEYAVKDSRVVVIHQENRGLSAARNAGIDWAFSNSDSQWLTFIDSDDWVHPEYLQHLLDAAADNDVSVSVCGYVQTDGKEPEITPETLTTAVWSAEDFYVEHNVNATVAWGKLYRKACFREIRYPVGKIHEDEFVTHTILFPAGRIAVLDAPLYYYFINMQGIMKATWRPARLDAIEALKNQVLFMKKKRFTAGYMYAVNKLAHSYAYQMSALKKNDVAQKKQYLTQLQISLRRLLWKNYKCVPFTTSKWVYECAFPCEMWVYWTVKGILNNLGKTQLEG